MGGPVLRSGRKWPFGPPHEPLRRSGRDCRRARTVRLDAVLGPPRRSVPVGDSSTPESRTLTPLIMVRIQIPQPVITYLILHILLSFQEAYFLVNLRGFR